jgi:uncharacterized protein (DUF433 family)
MTATIVDIGMLIVRSPEMCGDRPRIVGTRITVGQLATLWKQGLSAEQIQYEYPHLKLDQIYAGLAYYHANKEEIEAILAKDIADYEKYQEIYSQKQGI